MNRIVVPVLSVSAADAIAEVRAGVAAEVVAVAIDVGQPGGLEGLRDAALAVGALRCHAVDMREAFAERLCWPALRAGAVGVAGEPVVAALSMPLVAETVADICRHEGASAAVVWSDSQGDRQRLRALLRDVGPTLGLVSVRAGAAAVARNLWAAVAPLNETTPWRAAPAQPGGATLRIGFDRGLATRLNGVALTPAELIQSLATIAADHGVGAWSVAAPTGDGRAWRVDAPAALVLARAVATLADRVLDARTRNVYVALGEIYAGLVRDGAWFTPVRHGVDAFMARVFDDASGDVTVQIDSGRIEVEA